MFRIFGFIVGSIVSIGALVMLVGMPDFHLTGEVSGEDRYDVAIQQLKEKQQSLTEIVESIPIAEAVDDILPDDEPDEAAGIETSADSSEELDDAVAVDVQMPEKSINDKPIDGLVETSLVEEIAEPAWHAFWNPFRSEIAAKGFVRRLENVTGLDYRIVKVKSGVYQVGFSYNNDTELSTKLSQISAATGLDLSDNFR